MRTPVKGSVLFAGQSYYHCFYLSRALRKLGWRADVLNWDPQESNERFYHGEDFLFTYQHENDIHAQVEFYFRALETYDIFHFSNQHRMSFGPLVHKHFIDQGHPPYTELRLLKERGKKIVYSNNGCNDGVLQTSFRAWNTPEPLCDFCGWRKDPGTCSDGLNRQWGEFRNAIADYQCNTGGNRQDYNSDSRVHEVPGFYCVDDQIWRPDLEIPEQYRVKCDPEAFKIYHAVGNFDVRTYANNVNIKSSHIWLPLIERLKSEGHKVELIFCTNVPNRVVRYYQLQADIVGEMLSFGWFGANGRESLMLGKPLVCYLRPEWLESIATELPEYVREMPLVVATPDTVYDVVRDLMTHPEKRAEIGRKSREFALRWHSAVAGAHQFDSIYSELLGIQAGQPPKVPELPYGKALKLGEAYESAGQYDSAEDAYRTALYRRNGDIAARLGLARIEFQRENFYACEQIVTPIVSSEQRTRDSVILLARCREEQGDDAGAHQLYRAVLALDPVSPEGLAGIKRTQPAA